MTHTKYGYYDRGVYVSGDTLYSPTEQAYYVIQFARNEGFEAELPNFDNMAAWGVDELEDFGFLLEEAVAYLNNNCVEDGYVFTFRDTDFVLIGGNEFE